MDSKHILKQLAKSKNKKRRTRQIDGFLTIFKLIILLVVSAAIVIATNQIFKIKTIKISQRNLIKADYLYQENLLLLDVDKEVNKIIFDNPNISELSLIKQYPSTIIIDNIKKEIPICQFKVDSGYYILSTTGKILNKTRKRKLGMVPVNFYQRYNYNQYPVGTTLINSEILLAIKIITAYQKYNLPIKSIDIASNDMILLHSDVLIVFSVKKSIDIQILQSKAVLQKIKQQGLKINKLDFRFDKPILTY